MKTMLCSLPENGVVPPEVNGDQIAPSQLSSIEHWNFVYENPGLGSFYLSLQLSYWFGVGTSAEDKFAYDKTVKPFPVLKGMHREISEIFSSTKISKT